MKFVDQVTKMIAEYPSLFHNRVDAMNQLFCVIGNGYDWVDGALVEAQWDNVEDQREIEGREKEAQQERKNLMRETYTYIANSKQPEQSVAHAKEKLAEMDAELIRSAMAAELAATRVDSMSREQTFYPLSKYSAIRCVPPDVKPDWLEAVKEMTEILAKHGIKV